MSFLTVHCPRLHLARHQRCIELTRERATRRRARSALLEWERVTAHRELQLARAYVTGSRRYIIHRERKLDVARRMLTEARANASVVGA